MSRERGGSLASRRGADRPPAVWAAARSPRGHTGCHRDGTSAVWATASESAVLGCSPRQLHSASFLDWKALHTRARDATVSPAACCNSRAGRGGALEAPPCRVQVATDVSGVAESSTGQGRLSGVRF